jgi:uncharacterized OB-fold protein
MPTTTLGSGSMDVRRTLMSATAEALPGRGGPMAESEAHLAAGRFMIQRCTSCDRNVFHPRRLCPHCGHPALEWIAASGHGTVHATTVVARSQQRGGNYNVALVDLDEGVRMMSRVEDIPPAAVRIGMPVFAEIRAIERGPLVVFVPAQAGGRERDRP